jgi:hypothetical protein
VKRWFPLVTILVSILFFPPARGDEEAGEGAQGEREQQQDQQDEEGQQEHEGQDEQIEFPPEIEELLKQASDPEAYGETVRCIQTRSVRSTTVLDDQHIIFRLSGSKYYLVQFKHRCPRLRRGSALIYETRISQLCRLDQVRASNSAGSGDVGPPCMIPGFIEVTDQQASLLEETLKTQRKR